ncbi:FecR family protein [Neotamlana nanhaiensis]|uniref:FecR family protein n=1 Tax=Neotamlana nanhaiensis TaxID=1382798 RepID=UPI000699BF21|nr:FecR family protein [Tamlana nanhaiensis]
MISENIENLITKFLCNQASATELDTLEQWLEQPENKVVFNTYVKIKYGMDYNYKTFNKNRVKEKLNAIIDEEKQVIKMKRFKTYTKYAAAILVIGLMASAYFYKDSFFYKTEPLTPQISTVKNIEPGTQRAILTLENGAEVVLQKGKNFSTQKLKSNGEEIVYSNKNSNKSNIAYNYITVPRGGEFSVKLADGTMVWLNSESQLKYPVNFTKGQTRSVELVYGEAYFDVSPSTAHNGDKFKVLHANQDIEVFGTEFNVKAYKDETNIYTTLVEGSIALNNTTVTKKLVPGQQANLNTISNQVDIYSVDVYNEISWKDGVFSFERKSLKDIMKVLSRWYDFKVIFKTKALENEKFIGVLGREQNIEDILKSIQASGIIKNYNLYDKTIELE